MSHTGPDERQQAAQAHAKLDRLIALLRQHGGKEGAVRVRLDRAGVLHAVVTDVALDLEDGLDSRGTMNRL